jgi:hypothetical protein
MSALCPLLCRKSSSTHFDDDFFGKSTRLGYLIGSDSIILNAALAKIENC